MSIASCVLVCVWLFFFFCCVIYILLSTPVYPLRTCHGATKFVWFIMNRKMLENGDKGIQQQSDETKSEHIDTIGSICVGTFCCFVRSILFFINLFWFGSSDFVRRLIVCKRMRVWFSLRCQRFASVWHGNTIETELKCRKKDKTDANQGQNQNKIKQTNSSAVTVNVLYAS